VCSRLYYGEITYIDACIGRILKAVEARGDADNTLIRSYFEASAHVPFLVSWPGRIPAGERRESLVALTDLFGIATSAAGTPEFRQGVDALGVIAGTQKARDALFGYYGEPGTRLFKIMVRHEDWKYIFFANGGREQLFNLREDPNELRNRAPSDGDVARALRGRAIRACGKPEARLALNGTDLKALPFEARPLSRIYQFDQSRGVTGFPKNPPDVLNHWV
jgi:arylsulfatase